MLLFFFQRQYGDLLPALARAEGIGKGLHGGQKGLVGKHGRQFAGAEHIGHERRAAELALDVFDVLDHFVAGHGNDGLYIISNDDSLITMGSNAVLNGYVYTPYGAVYIAPSESRYTALNGCMAIESLIVLTTADEIPTGSIGEEIKKWWENLIGGGDATESVDALVKQYENIIFNYVQPPLITDSVLMGGLTDQEVTDFNSVVWEFLGYY